MTGPSQFVILRHVGYGREHFDLMLESGEVLLTWQLLKYPRMPGCAGLPAARIGDHRKEYLDYQGPISGGRGRVVRIDRGELVIENLTADRCLFWARGAVLNGRFELARTGEQWQLSPR